MAKNIKINKIITALFVLVLFIAGAVAIYYFSEQEEKPKDDIPKQIDDSISPLTNQAVFLEIHRIRRNGIIDQMENSGNQFVKNLINKLNNYKIRLALEGMRPGKGWDEKPSFSYIAVLDDYTEEGREELVEKGEIKPWEEGFSEGAEQKGELGTCAHCGKPLSQKESEVVEREIDGEKVWFCSDKCAAKGPKKE